MITIHTRDIDSRQVVYSKSYPKDYIKPKTLAKMIRMEEGEKFSFDKTFTMPEENVVISYYAKMIKKDHKNLKSVYEISRIVTPLDKEVGFKNTKVNTKPSLFKVKGSAKEAYLFLLEDMLMIDPDINFFDIYPDALGEDIYGMLDYYDSLEYLAKKPKK